jgi:hypothetical protein
MLKVGGITRERAARGCGVSFDSSNFVDTISRCSRLSIEFVDKRLAQWDIFESQKENISIKVMLLCASLNYAKLLETCKQISRISLPNIDRRCLSIAATTIALGVSKWIDRGDEIISEYALSSYRLSRRTKQECVRIKFGPRLGEAQQKAEHLNGRRRKGEVI